MLGRPMLVVAVLALATVARAELPLDAVRSPAGSLAPGAVITVSPAATGAPAAPSGGAPGRGADKRPRPAPRAVLLKLKGDACLSCAIASGRGVGAVVPGTRLDDLNRRFGVRAARPLIGAHARGAVPETGAERTARDAALRARFATRARRVPAGEVVPDLSRVYRIELRHAGDLAAAVRAYAADPAVEYCEPDAVYETALTPNDPYLATSGTWGQPFDDLWGVKRIAAPAAWDTTRGAGVVVAVVDTGIDYTHPDIAANVWTNPGEIPGNGIDDDGNGFVDDVHGWDFADVDADPMDDFFHGTHVAGTIAAVGDNALGVVGVAYESKVMAVRALDSNGIGFLSDLAAAIVYATDNGADVINASWGASGTSAALADAIAYAYAHGVVFVAAAGNSNEPATLFNPANDPHAITVAASDHTDQRASFSNYGIKIDVTAPGGGDAAPPPDNRLPDESVLSLYTSHSVQSLPPELIIAGRYLRLAGTSMATPHVAGTAALVLALHPDFTVEQVRQVLRSSADDVGVPGVDSDSGYGRVNAAHAVAAGTPLDAHIATPASGTIVGAVTISIVGDADGPGFTSYTLEYGSGATPTTWTTIAGPVTTPVSGGALADWDVSAVRDGDYVLRLLVDRPGATFEDRVAVTLKNLEIETPEQLSALRPGPIEIRGTAAGAGFASYTVEYRRPALDKTLWRTDGITLPGDPATPVRHDVLAVLDTSGLTAGDRFDFRVTVQTASGPTAVTRSGIVIDPTLRQGWPQQLVPVADRDYLTVADLDGDGIKEILVGSGGSVVVFEPDGSIRAGWPQTVTTGTNFDTLGSPIAADVIGDGRLEVIATNRQNLFVWDADGTLAAGFPLHVDLWNGGNAWLTAADLDGDGKDEILCAGFLGTQAFFGDGSEVPGWSRYWTSDSPLAVGDVFGNGSLAVAMHSSFVFGLPRQSIWLRGADRALLPGWPRTARETPFGRLAMADMNGDGTLEMVTLDERKGLKFKATAFDALGNSHGLTHLKRPKGSHQMQSNGSLSFADLDGDGRAEAYTWVPFVFAANPYYFWHAAPAAFFRMDLPKIVAPGPLVTHAVFNWASWDFGGIAIGDIDGDGTQELVGGVDGYDECDPTAGCRPYDDAVRRGVVVQHRDGTLMGEFPKPLPQYVVSDGDVNPTLEISFFLDDPRLGTPAIADLDGDGLKEVVWVDPQTTRLFVWNVAGAPGPELADWPMFEHDAKHTNALPARH